MCLMREANMSFDDIVIYVMDTVKNTNKMIQLMLNAVRIRPFSKKCSSL